jgi:uncharacterized DUF497 family protein
MDFEYDSKKSELNKVKHGIDFEEAQELWKDLSALEVPSGHASEDRFLMIGKINKIGWTAIITYRDSTTRIISVRRWRDHEAKAYDNSRRVG